MAWPGTAPSVRSSAKESAEMISCIGMRIGAGAKLVRTRFCDAEDSRGNLRLASDGLEKAVMLRNTEVYHLQGQRSTDANPALPFYRTQAGGKHPYSG